jgi:uncharacterized protein (DUF58 family)
VSRFGVDRWPAWLMLCAALFAAAWIAGGGLTWHLALACMGVLALALLGTGMAPLASVTVERQMPSQPVRAGDDIEVTLHVRRPGWWPWLQMVVHDELPAVLSPTRSRRLVLQPGWRRDVTVNYRIPAVPRGLHRLGPVSVESGDPFGFFMRRRRAGGEDWLEVWPAVVALDALRQVPATRFPVFTAADVPAPEGIRAMVPGDRWQRVHWLSTARTGQFMVRRFEPPTPGEWFIGLDVPEAFQHAEYEVALAVAASLATYATRHGFGVTVAVSHEDARRRLTAGPGHLDGLMRGLATVRHRRGRSVPPPPRVPPGFAPVVIISPRPDAWRFAAPSVLRIGIGRHGAALEVRRLEDLPAALAGRVPHE